MRLSICVRVYSGIRYVVQLNISGLTCGPPGDRGESWLPHSWYHHDKGIHKSLLLALRLVSVTMQRNNPGPWSRVCMGPTVNIVR